MSFLFHLLSRFPLPLLHALGALAGWGYYAVSGAYRQRLRANLPADLVRTTSPLAVAAATGQGLFELPWLWLRPQAEVVAKVVKVDNWSLVEEAWAAGKGILFLTPHLGCFEITAQYYANHRPMTVLYRKPKRASLVALVEGGRGANLKLAPADLSGVRSLLKALKQGEAVGMLPDQVPGSGEGVWVPFFGRPAYTMTLAPRLADTGATVLLAYAERLAGGRGYHLKLFPLPDALTGDAEQKAAAINRALEGLIRQCPEQYAWGYNRYKRPSGAPLPPAGDATDPGMPPPNALSPHGGPK
ncbi:lysophospholipid acyltransferase family protein [Denitratisoma sp. agr-D3]